jgi:hypothetical protein
MHRLEAAAASTLTLLRQPTANLALLIFVIAVGFIAPGSAQLTYDGNNNLPPFGSFGTTGFDTVSLQNGNLHISIPIVTLPGRGKPVTYNFVYDSIDFTKTLNPPVPPSHTNTLVISEDVLYTGWALRSSADWTFESIPGFKVTYSGFSGSFATQTYVVVDPERMKHPMAVINAPTDPCTFGTPRGLATDGSGILLDLNANTITTKDGVVPGNVEDTNGNLQNHGISGGVTMT